MADLNLSIRQFLAADSAINTAFGSRIYAGRIVPNEGYKPSDGACICFNPRGGPLPYEKGVPRTPSIQFKVYAQTGQEANTAHEIVYGAIHHAPAGAAVVWCELEAEPSILREPDTQWPYVLAFYSFTIRS